MVLKSLTDRNSIARKIVTGASAGCVFRSEYDKFHDHIGVPCASLDRLEFVCPNSTPQFHSCYFMF